MICPVLVIFILFLYHVKCYPTCTLVWKMLYNSWGNFSHRFNFTSKGLFKEFCKKIKWCILRGSKSSDIKKVNNKETRTTPVTLCFYFYIWTSDLLKCFYCWLRTDNCVLGRLTFTRPRTLIKYFHCKKNFPSLIQTNSGEWSLSIPPENIKTPLGFYRYIGSAEREFWF